MPVWLTLVSGFVMLLCLLCEDQCRRLDSFAKPSRGELFFVVV
jgi:hypothetical protein